MRFFTTPKSYLSWMIACHRAYKRRELRMWVRHEQPELNEDIPMLGIVTLHINAIGDEYAPTRLEE